MGMIRHKGGAGYGKGYNPHPSAAPDTVRDDSGMSTQAMTERRAQRDAPRDPKARRTFPIKIGAQYETWHEPDSPEGSAILKDKAGKAKALKKVNKEYGKEYSKDDTVQARSESYDRAKKDEAQWGQGQDFGPAATYVKGGSKAEMKQHQYMNKTRIENEKNGY